MTPREIDAKAQMRQDQVSPETRAKFVIGSQSLLDSLGPVPELLNIDEEVNRPLITEPLLWNSQAWSRRLEIPWIIAEIGEPRRLAVLDVGSGGSALPIFLARHGAAVTSVDPDFPSGLPGGLNRIHAALPRLPFKDCSFDVVCCVSVLEHLPTDVTLSFRELCRVARKSLLVTFDIATTPLAMVGLSGLELRAFSKATGMAPEFPPDPLVPIGPEKAFWAGGIGVCLMRVEKTDNGWPVPRLNTAQMKLVRLHRRIQSWVWRVRRTFRKRRGDIEAESI